MFIRITYNTKADISCNLYLVLTLHKMYTNIHGARIIINFIYPNSQLLPHYYSASSSFYSLFIIFPTVFSKCFTTSVLITMCNISAAAPTAKLKSWLSVAVAKQAYPI